MTELRYHEAAEEEVLAEIQYLKQHARGLSGSEALPGIRRCVLRTFQYSLIYTIEDRNVLVLALAHHSRRPAYWLDGLRSWRARPDPACLCRLPSPVQRGCSYRAARESPQSL